MTPQSEKLRVAFPRACNLQQTPPDCATPHATVLQPPSLKALARKALTCNNSRNASATAPPETVQLPCNETGAKVAQKLQPEGEPIRARLARLAEREGRAAVLVNRIPAADLPEYAGMEDAQLSALLSMLSDDADRQAGRVPTGDTAAILCRSCGPVWAHPSIARVLPVVGGWPRALGCPWCFIRAKGIPIPRPRVTCADCQHYQPDSVNPPQGMGCCNINANRGGTNWLHQRRVCAQFQPKEPTP